MNKVSVILGCYLWNDSYPGEELSRSLTKNAVHVTYELVHVSLATSLLDDVLVVVIPQSTGQLLVVHLWLILPESPSSCNLSSTELEVVRK